MHMHNCALKYLASWPVSVKPECMEYLCHYVCNFFGEWEIRNLL